MARPRVGTDGFVYFLYAEEVDRVKIGFSTELRFWQNDNQIADLHARKLWRLPAEPAGVRVTIHELASEPVEEASTNV